MSEYYIYLEGEKREVCLRRARKLKRRGEHVEYSRTTVNGKDRFLWTWHRPLDGTPRQKVNVCGKD